MKKWYKSKTLWVNAIALAAMGVQMATGFVVSPDMQALALGAINLVLRGLTDSAIGNGEAE